MRDNVLLKLLNELKKAIKARLAEHFVAYSQRI